MAAPDRLDAHRTTRISQLLSLAMLRHEQPANGCVAATASRARAEILDGRDDRLIVGVGPCSFHDPAAALDYAARITSGRPRSQASWPPGSGAVNAASAA